MTYSHTDAFYIDGAWVSPLGSNVIDVIDPATEAPFAQLAMGSQSDVDRAVAAAKAAFPAWSQTSREERLAVISRILDVYKRRFEEFAQAISTEMGAPISFSRDEQAAVGVSHLEAVIDALKDFTFEETLENGDLLVRGPIGVCGLITPWNWPVNQIVLKVIPALAAGCTMVLKPSELTPVSAILYAEVLDEAGVPAGVFNLVHGEGPVVGAALSRHPDIAMMSFTGSTRGGVAVTHDSADLVKRVALELGGKSANLIFADADVDAMVTAGVQMCMGNTGQSCDAPTRMLVERSVYDQAVDVAIKACNAITVGAPDQEGDHIGPLTSQMQFDKVQAMIQMALDEGARLIAGGLGHPEGFDTGYYVRPTVFADIHNDMRIAREEVFGPVLVMIPFDTEEDAIRIANDTPYGLSSYLSSGDPDRIRRVALRLEAGNVNVNGGYIAAGSPFGGYKQSGIGREGGELGLEEFLEAKAISAY
ncbi:aldehyde dehydrogenase family protein [Shimia thalassica]|uniref:aldehyde dehydrogenase family protein n=1 Tax=Shimia thalassica TaxID=1715693 RepID=UPI0026E125CF|nr:aldehyde dehydrogenase family protein [Shimia thalassica]MDO6522554.1 aldehyde dehydrogenase family protein [Shimia thalassica]